MKDLRSLKSFEVMYFFFKFRKLKYVCKKSCFDSLRSLSFFPFSVGYFLFAITSLFGEQPATFATNVVERD